jgi:hypothetical protein
MRQGRAQRCGGAAYRNRTTMMATEMGTTALVSDELPTSRPSMADSTEMAGVMIPSLTSRLAPTIADTAKTCRVWHACTRA